MKSIPQEIMISLGKIKMLLLGRLSKSLSRKDA